MHWKNHSNCVQSSIIPTACQGASCWGGALNALSAASWDKPPRRQGAKEKGWLRLAMGGAHRKGTKLPLLVARIVCRALFRCRHPRFQILAADSDQNGFYAKRLSHKSPRRVLLKITQYFSTGSFVLVGPSPGRTIHPLFRPSRDSFFLFAGNPVPKHRAMFSRSSSGFASAGFGQTYFTVSKERGRVK